MACPWSLSKLAHLAQRLANLFERFLHRHFLGQAVGPDFDARGAHVLGEQDVFFGGFDVLAELGLVRRVIIESAAQAKQFHFRILEALFHFRALLLGEVDLDLVRVGGAQLHAFELRRFAVLDDRGDIPIRGQVVGHQPQVHFGRTGKLRGGSALRSGVEGQCANRCQRRCRLEIVVYSYFSDFIRNHKRSAVLAGE